MNVLFVSCNLNDKLNGATVGSLRNFECVRDLFPAKQFNTYKLGIFDIGSVNPAYYINRLFSLIRLRTAGISTIRLNEIDEIISQQQIDCVFLDSSLLGLVAKRIKDRLNNRVKVVTFFHNIEIDLLKQEIESGKRILWLRVPAVKHNERLAHKYSDEVFVLNNRDGNLLCKYYGERKCVIVPVTAKDFFPGIEEPHIHAGEKFTLLFVGSAFFANLNGIKWFVNNVMPHVTAKLIIVGNEMDKHKQELTGENIHVYGRVENLVSLYSEAHVIVAPIFIGGGMKVKIAEALMFGKYILGTSEAFTGYELDYEQLGGLCNTAEEFIEKIREFMQHPAIHELQFNRYAREIYLERYSNAKAREIFKAVFDGL